MKWFYDELAEEYRTHKETYTWEIWQEDWGHKGKWNLDLIVGKSCNEISDHLTLTEAKVQAENIDEQLKEME